jgi:hypothetical protein
MPAMSEEIALCGWVAAIVALTNLLKRGLLADDRFIEIGTELMRW